MSVSYLVADHLGNMRVVDTGPSTSEQHYLPWGEIPGKAANNLSKKYTWRAASPQRRAGDTGQRQASAIGGIRLRGYGARHCWPFAGRFISPDTLVPSPGNPQALNRYAYVNNNPLRYKDPSGHWLETAWDIANIAWDIYEVRCDPSLLNIGALVVDVGAAVLPVVPAGVGMVVRGGKAAKAALEVASHADEVVDAAKAVSKVEDVRHARRSAEVTQSVLTKSCQNSLTLQHDSGERSMWPKKVRRP